jgi:GT2 family glycosyltransferase
VRVIRIEKNVGYAEGCNRGIEASSGDLVAVLNNDAVLQSQWLEKLLEHDHEPWSFWASLILFASEPDKIDSAGDAMAVVGAGFRRAPAVGAKRTERSFRSLCRAALPAVLLGNARVSPDFF